MHTRLAVVALAGAFLAIYLPDLGHGFVRDDFGWIAASRASSPAELMRFLTHQLGFYRPLISVTFSIDYAIWQLDSFGYALTNVVLFVTAAGLLFRLARTLSLPASAALVTVAVWAFDIHAPRMALLWISGRTALALCVFAVAAADAFLRGRHRLAGLCALLAMLSKEEAALLPFVLMAFTWLDRPPSASLRWSRERLSGLFGTTWPMWAALAAYGVLRVNSDAFGPANLPEHYPVIDGVAPLVRNIGEYAVRAGLLSALVIVVMTLVIRPSLALQQDERRVLVFSALWTVGFFAVTIAAANRSDLYALAPSIGCALVAGAVAANARRSNAVRFRLACTGLVVALVLLIPVYWQRDRRWVQPADVSASVMRTLVAGTPPTRQGRIVLFDDVAMRYGLESAFGTLLPAAVSLFKGPGWSAELRRTGEGCEAAAADAGTSAFVFRAGTLSRCSP